MPGMHERKRFQMPAPSALDRLGGALDRVFCVIAPTYGANRMFARSRQRLTSAWAKHREEQLAAGWADDRTDERLRGAKWLSQNLSPDSALEIRLEELRKRSEKLYEEDGYATGAVEGMVTNIVGTGIVPQARIELKGASQEANDQLNADVEHVYNIWACRCDKTRRQSYYDIQRLLIRNWLVQGEAFLLMSDVKRDVSDVHEPLPLALEVVDASRVESPPHKVADRLCRMGVQKNNAGRILGYWVRDKHPGDTVEVEQTHTFIPAWRMLHLFEQLYAGQSRGVPWFTPVMDRLKDLGDFAEAELIAQEVAACHAGFVKNAGDPEAVANANRKAGSSADDRLQAIEPGRIQYLGLDEEIEFSNPSRPGNTLAPYMQWQLRSVAAGLNYPYELLVKDYRELSYSGGRLALIDGRVMFRCRQSQLCEKTLDHVWAQVVREIAIWVEGVINLLDYEADPLAYEAVQHQSPGWPWVDPQKEVAAAKEALGEDLTTLASELAARGMDLLDVERDRLKEGRLKIDRWAQLIEHAEKKGIELPTLLALFFEKAQSGAGKETAEEDEKTPQRAAA